MIPAAFWANAAPGTDARTTDSSEVKRNDARACDRFKVVPFD
jgi:hypothetical protein